MLNFFSNKAPEVKLAEELEKHFRSLYKDIFKKKQKEDQYQFINNSYAPIRMQILDLFLKPESFSSIKDQLKLGNSITYETYESIVKRVSFNELKKLEPNVSGDENSYYTF